jgi:PH domain
LATNFLNAYHVSDLEVMSKGFLGITNWDKRLCVLSNIGLLIFTKAEDKNPRLFPSIDASYKPLPPAQYNKNNAFRLKIVNGEEIVLAAFCTDDQNMWKSALTKLKEDTDKRRKALDNKH